MALTKQVDYTDSPNWALWNIELFGRLYSEYKESQYMPVGRTIRLQQQLVDDLGDGVDVVSTKVGVVSETRPGYSAPSERNDNFGSNPVSVLDSFELVEINEDSDVTASMASTFDGGTVDHEMIVSILLQLWTVFLRDSD
jgi:hypothetical protein